MTEKKRNSEMEFNEEEYEQQKKEFEGSITKPEIYLKHEYTGYNQVFKYQPEELRYAEEAKDEKSKKLIKHFEESSPFRFLCDITNSMKPSKWDLKIVEDSMLNYFLNAGVVNVAINYVLYKTDMKLTKEYFESVCLELARSEIKTVPEAMTYFKEYIKAEKKKG